MRWYGVCKVGLCKEETMQNICFLAKFSELSKRAMPSAINIAKEYGAKLYELHV